MLCCAILGQGGMVNADVYLWDRKEGEGFLGDCKVLLVWQMLIQADVGAVPFGPSGTSHKGLVPLGRESCISGVTPYCWGNGEGNSCV